MRRGKVRGLLWLAASPCQGSNARQRVVCCSPPSCCLLGSARLSVGRWPVSHGPTQAFSCACACADLTLACCLLYRSHVGVQRGRSGGRHQGPQHRGRPQVPHRPDRPVSRRPLPAAAAPTATSLPARPAALPSFPPGCCQPPGCRPCAGSKPADLPGIECRLLCHGRAAHGFDCPHLPHPLQPRSFFPLPLGSNPTWPSSPTSCTSSPWVRSGTPAFHQLAVAQGSQGRQPAPACPQIEPVPPALPVIHTHTLMCLSMPPLPPLQSACATTRARPARTGGPSAQSTPSASGRSSSSRRGRASPQTSRQAGTGEGAAGQRAAGEKGGPLGLAPSVL